MNGATKVPDDFREKVVLVTGAGSGIGREAAQAFAARGGLVYSADLNERGLAETKDLIEHAGGKVRVARVDVSEEREVAAFLARINKELGRLDVAFNNSGITGGAASKCGVHGLTRVAAIENSAHNIQVNTLVPGWTETPMVVSNCAQNPGFAALATSAIPAKRGGRPSEVAVAAVWLCSPEASYVFGQMLVVDGGMTVGGFEYIEK